MTEWRFPTRSIAIRLFFTCWVVYAMHFATNIVREIYLAVSLGEDYTFRVDEYAGLHPDLFETPGRGWHINNNPGSSMLGAIPYALNRVWIDPVAERVIERRSKSGATAPPEYDSPWPMARDFYAQAWRRGLDVKLGLAALVMQLWLMAPLSAGTVVLMFYVLREIYQADRTAFWLAILFAFGTPVFFRTGTINQNLMTAYLFFAGFVLLWKYQQLRYSLFLAGFAAGFCVLLDYSGVIQLAVLFVYGIFKHRDQRMRYTMLFAAGAVGPIATLCFYQWVSFGHPLYPPQYYMPTLDRWVDTGFRGFVGPQPGLFWALLFDYRYGLFLSCPLLLLALFSYGKRHLPLPKLEWIWILMASVILALFFSGVSYTHLQFNTGIRYLVAIVPLLFLPAAAVLVRLPRAIGLLISIVSILFSWCLAMYRDVERGAGIAEPLIRIFTEGFQLPAWTTLSRVEGMREYLPFDGSPLPVFAAGSMILWFLWFKRGESQNAKIASQSSTT